MAGNTSGNTFQPSVSANQVWKSKDGKYTVTRLNVGLGFKVHLTEGGENPRALRGRFTAQRHAIEAIEAYEARLATERPTRARKQQANKEAKNKAETTKE